MQNVFYLCIRTDDRMKKFVVSRNSDMFLQYKKIYYTPNGLNIFYMEGILNFPRIRTTCTLNMIYMDLTTCFNIFFMDNIFLIKFMVPLSSTDNIFFN